MPIHMIITPNYKFVIYKIARKMWKFQCFQVTVVAEDLKIKNRIYKKEKYDIKESFLYCNFSIINL